MPDPTVDAPRPTEAARGPDLATIARASAAARLKETTGVVVDPSLESSAFPAAGSEVKTTPDSDLRFIDKDKGIDKPKLQTETNGTLAEASETIKKAVDGMDMRQDILAIRNRLSDAEKADFDKLLGELRAKGGEANGWRVDNYADGGVFDRRIVEKAQEYGRNRPEKSNDDNYFDALGERHDQAVAVGSVFQELAGKVAGLTEITADQKNNLAHELADKIRTNGEQIKTAAGREELVRNKTFTQDQVDAIVKSGLVAGADVEPTFHKAEFAAGGFPNQEAWDKAVYETASGILEDRLVGQIKEIAGTDTGRLIYEKAMDVWKKRTGAKEPESKPTIEDSKPKKETVEDIQKKIGDIETQIDITRQAGGDPAALEKQLEEAKYQLGMTGLMDAQPKTEDATVLATSPAKETAPTTPTTETPPSATRPDSAADAEKRKADIAEAKKYMAETAKRYIQRRQTTRNFWKTLLLSWTSGNKDFTPQGERETAREEYHKARDKYIELQATEDVRSEFPDTSGLTPEDQAKARAEYDDKLGQKEAVLLSEEILRFSSNETALNVPPKLLRVLSKLGRNPLVRVGIAAGFWGSTVTGFLPGMVGFGAAQAATGYIGLKGSMDLAAEQYAARFGAEKKDINETKIGGMKLEERTQREAALYEARVKNSQTEVGATEENIRKVDAQAIREAVQRFISENKITGDTPEARAKCLTELLQKEKTIAIYSRDVAIDKKIDTNRRRNALRGFVAAGAVGAVVAVETGIAQNAADYVTNWWNGSTPTVEAVTPPTPDVAGTPLGPEYPTNTVNPFKDLSPDGGMPSWSGWADGEIGKTIQELVQTQDPMSADAFNMRQPEVLQSWIQDHPQEFAQAKQALLDEMKRLNPGTIGADQVTGLNINYLQPKGGIATFLKPFIKL